MASDARLVELIRTGRPDAFEALYDRHHRAILSFCRHMLGTMEEAEDAVQHTFLAAYNSLQASDEPIHLRAWLFAIARNRCYSVLRRRREQSFAGVTEPATEGLATVVQRREELRDLVGDMRKLPDDQRAALVLAELDSLSHEQIGLVLGVPTRKVKALVFQARESLLASRTARDIDCSEIREQLTNLHGGALRRSHLRRHLHDCAGCREFRREVDRQRRQLRVILPVTAPFALKGALLGATVGGGAATVGGQFAGGGIGHGGHLLGGGAAGSSGVVATSGGVAGGGLLVSSTLKGGLVKAVLGAILATVGAAGTIIAVGGGLPQLLSGAPALKPSAPGLSHHATNQVTGISAGFRNDSLPGGAKGSGSIVLVDLLTHAGRFPSLSRGSSRTSGSRGEGVVAASSGAGGGHAGGSGTVSASTGDRAASTRAATKPSSPTVLVSSTTPSAPSHSSSPSSPAPTSTYSRPTGQSSWSPNHNNWSPTKSYSSSYLHSDASHSYSPGSSSWGNWHGDTASNSWSAWRSSGSAHSGGGRTSGGEHGSWGGSGHSSGRNW